MTDQPFQIGDLVTSPWDPINADVVRRITDIRENRDFSSGWVVCADNGGVDGLKDITCVDASWFCPTT